MTGKACGIVTRGAKIQVFRVNCRPRGSQMAIRAQAAGCFLSKVCCLQNQGVGMAMATKISDVAGNALTTRGLASSAACQGAIN